jgi:hypothetical protein
MNIIAIVPHKIVTHRYCQLVAVYNVWLASAVPALLNLNNIFSQHWALLPVNNSSDTGMIHKYSSQILGFLEYTHRNSGISGFFCKYEELFQREWNPIESNYLS